MLDVKIIPLNSGVVLDGLQQLGENFKPAAMLAMERAAVGIH